METYYGKIKERLIEVVRRTNDMAEKKDIKRNHREYGSFLAWRVVLKDMGHEVKVAAIEERGFVKFFSISIDGEKESFTV